VTNIRYDTIREKSLAWAPQKLSDQLNLAYVAKKWKEETKTNKSEDLLTVMRWYAQDEVKQEETGHNEVDEMKKGADSTGEVMHI